MILVQHLYKRYTDAGQSLVIFEDLNFGLEHGDTVALMGESGAGKSTLLHMLGGFVSVDSGSITIGDASITGMNDVELSRFRRRHLGMVFQDFNLIDSLTARDNITFTRRLNGMPALDEATSALIKILKLDHRLDHLPAQLSGGERQRVAIARALAARPTLLLADEPTGNLDENTADRVMHQLMDAVQLSGATLLLVTHSRHTASFLKQTWHLAKGQLHC